MLFRSWWGVGTLSLSAPDGCGIFGTVHDGWGTVDGWMGRCLIFAARGTLSFCCICCSCIYDDI